MKQLRLVGLVSILALCVVGLVPAPAGAAPGKPAAPVIPLGGLPAVSTGFLHVARAANISGSSSDIDHPASNSNPNAIVFATQNWNPSAVGGTYNAHPFGVWYDGANSQWAVFNEDASPMPAGAAFNIYVTAATASIFVHTATAGNITGNYTLIDNAVANGHPEYVLLVTQNWNPGGVGGTYNAHAVGTWYDSGSSRWSIFNEDGAAMPVGASFNVIVFARGPIGAASGTETTVADSSNTLFNTTFINDPLLNGNPDALFYATQAWNTGGAGSVYNPHEIGVYYSSTQQQWAVFNQDLANIPIGAGFDIVVLGSPAASFTHYATAGNTSGDATFIDNTLANGLPFAMVLVSHNWNPGGVGGTYLNTGIGVYYDTGLSQWGIYREDGAAMPVGAAFNVYIAPGGITTAYIHAARSANISGDTTYLDHPLLNGTPNAITFITHNFNPGGGGGLYDAHPDGVWYDTSVSQWAVFHEDVAALAAGTYYNVWVPGPGTGAYVHTATAGNIVGDYTVLTYPYLDNNPIGAALVTQNWNPGGVGGQYNNHYVGVWYTGANWAIYQEDQANMTVGANFNVVEIGPEALIPAMLRNAP